MGRLVIRDEKRDLSKGEQFTCISFEFYLGGNELKVQIV